MNVSVLYLIPFATSKNASNTDNAIVLESISNAVHVFVKLSYVITIGIPFSSASFISSYVFVTLFQLVTLPVEFNASRRALEGMRDCDLLDRQEIGAARKVLSAAAMTYVAALATSLASLLRLIVIFMGNRRSDR